MPPPEDPTVIKNSTVEVRFQRRGRSPCIAVPAARLCEVAPARPGSEAPNSPHVLRTAAPQPAVPATGNQPGSRSLGAGPARGAAPRSVRDSRAAF